MYIKFISKRSNISVIRNIVSAIVLDYNPTITYLNELKTVVSEAVTNCIVHGYNNEEDKFVDVTIKIQEDGVYGEIVDYGCGIEDIEQAKEPLFSTKKAEERSGLGFTIMEMFCDEFNVESKKNEGTKIIFFKKW